MVNLDFFGYVDQLLLGNDDLNKLNVFKTYSRIQTQVPYAMIISCHYLFIWTIIVLWFVLFQSVGATWTTSLQVPLM